jgi:hypothetical protein
MGPGSIPSGFRPSRPTTPAAGVAASGFRLPPARTRNDAWDLDNLLKPTLDALGGVIGWRAWNGRPQADDERIDRIVASKRTVTDREEPGARLRVVPLPAARQP